MVNKNYLAPKEGGSRIWLLSAIAKLLDVQFHIDGLPFGARRSAEPGASGSTAP